MFDEADVMNSLMRKTMEGLLGADKDIRALMRKMQKNASCLESFIRL